MDFKEIVSYLLEKKYMVFMGGQPVMTLEFIQKATEVGPKILKKEKVDRDILKQTWDYFVVSAQVPHKSNTDKVYVIRHYTPEGGMMLWSLQKKLGEDYNLLIAATKNYYKTVAYPMTLNNYLQKGVWEQELNEFKNKKTVTIGPGANKFES